MTLVLFEGFIEIWSLIFVPIKLSRNEQNIFTFLMNGLGFMAAVFIGALEVCGVL